MNEFPSYFFCKSVNHCFSGPTTVVWHHQIRNIFEYIKVVVFHKIGVIYIIDPLKIATEAKNNIFQIIVRSRIKHLNHELKVYHNVFHIPQFRIVTLAQFAQESISVVKDVSRN